MSEPSWPFSTLTSTQIGTSVVVSSIVRRCRCEKQARKPADSASYNYPIRAQHSTLTYLRSPTTHGPTFLHSDFHDP
jgi:hypothetical protein